MSLSLLRSSALKLTRCSEKIILNSKKLTTLAVLNLNSKIKIVNPKPLFLYNKNKLNGINSQISVRKMSSGDYTKVWMTERLVSLSLAGIVPAAIMFPSQYMDGVFAVFVVLHQYWGMEHICKDYVRPIIFGNTIPKIGLVIVVLLNLATIGGFFYFIYNNIGLGNAIREFWALKGKDGSEPPPPPPDPVPGKKK